MSNGSHALIRRLGTQRFGLRLVDIQRLGGAIALCGVTIAGAAVDAGAHPESSIERATQGSTHPASSSAASHFGYSGQQGLGQQVLAQTPPPPEQRRPRRRLGVRGSICAMSPGLLEPQNLIWSDRPLFLWQADTQYIQMQRLEVIDTNGRILWEKPLEPTAQAVVYNGQSLEFGEFYTWQLTWRVNNREDTIDYTFQRMDAETHQRIATDLETLSQQSQQATADEEAIAMRRASYFIDAELWSDAMQVLYTVESPSTTITQMLQDWTMSVCGDEQL